MKRALFLFALSSAPALAADPGLPAPDATWSVGPSTPVPAEAWWTRVGDPALERVVADVLDANPDVATTRARIAAAEALSAQGLATVLPSVTLDGSLSASRNLTSWQLGLDDGTSEPNPLFGDQPDVTWSGSAMVNLRAPIDVWGRNLLGYRAGSLDADAAASDGDDLTATLAGLASEAYLDVVAASERVALIERQLQTSDTLLQLVELRYERGDSTALDLLQQRQQRAQVAALLPQARQALRLRHQSLATLTGRPAWGELPEVAATLPSVAEPSGLGRPADLVDNRPDLHAAQHRYDAARARFQRANRYFLPTLGLAAGAGIQWQDRGKSTSTATWNAGATASVPLFNGGANAAGARAARATRDAAALSFESAVLVAAQEVEAALARDQEQRALLEATGVQLETARLTFDESRRRYVAGLTSYLSVLAALDALLRAELADVTARRDLVSIHISLRLALGGPWTSGMASEGGPR